MKVGDLVSYTGKSFQGPSLGGLILESKVALDVDDWRARENVNAHQVYWSSHNTINWVLEKYLEVSA